MRLLEMVTVYSSDRAAAGLVLAHGAGAGQASRFMVETSQALADRGVTTATFDFPYMSAGRSVPDKAPVLEAAWRDAVAAARAHKAFAKLPLFIGGKSMGGRIASQVAAQGIDGVTGLVYLGYPLHPPGRPHQRRDQHLPAITQPMLFVQGTRDLFGTADEIRALLPDLNPRATLHVVPDGDHSFKIRVKIAGRPQRAIIDEIYDIVAAFILRNRSSAA
jgi:uncharacterized protein